MAGLTWALVNLGKPDFDVSIRWQLFLLYVLYAAVAWLVNIIALKAIPALELMGSKFDGNSKQQNPAHRSNSLGVSDLFPLLLNRSSCRVSEGFRCFGLCYDRKCNGVRERSDRKTSC